MSTLNGMLVKDFVLSTGLDRDGCFSAGIKL